MAALSAVSVHAGVTYGGGDGSSIEKAIVIKDAKNSKQGVPAESAYARKHYAGYVLKSQLLILHGGKYYDVLEIEWKGKSVTLYFDISGFFPPKEK